MTGDHSPSPHAGACRTGAWGAAGALLGVVLSGPLALLVVRAMHPQPAWQDAEIFARHYHPIQSLPYLGGIVLVGSLVVMMASIPGIAGPAHRALTSAALAFTAAFAALITLNYAIQSTFIPALVQPFDDRNSQVIATLSMSNPKSLAWAIEMWGWGLFGLATGLAAPVFFDTPLERAVAALFITNCALSVAGALLAAIRPGWVMTPGGLVSFALWNLLLAVALGLALTAFLVRARRLEASRTGGGSG